MKTKTNTLKTGVVAGLCALSLMTGGVGVAITAPASASACETAELEASTSQITLYRVYNPRTGEHLYTKDMVEKAHLINKCGWGDEGVAWVSPTSGDEVYRLYNPRTGEHLYTKDTVERDHLKNKCGWFYEGICWYAPTSGVPLYRLYNPRTGEHLYTKDTVERDHLKNKCGWFYEGICWYGVDTSKTDTDTDKKDDTTKDDSSDTPTHTHNWQPVYTTVHHDAVTHEEPVYEKVWYEPGIYCTKHKVKCISNEERDADPAQLGWCPADKNCLANMTTIGYHEKYEQVQTGTQTVTKVIKEAYDEKVATGKYTCSCGATK